DDRRDTAESDALCDRAAFRRLGLSVGEQIVHRGAARISAADHDVFFLFAQISGGARERAAGSYGADESVDLAVGLVPNFWAGRGVVRLAIVEIVPLVGKQHAVLLALAQIVGEPPRDVLK